MYEYSQPRVTCKPNAGKFSNATSTVSTVADVQRIVDEQIDYYRARAAEYDQYYERSGPFDQGAEHKATWLVELEQATNWLQLDQIQGAVLDVAAGTGWWTSRLAEHATTVTAIDAAGETLEINRARTSAQDNVEHIEVDLFTFEPDRTFDVVFFGFWFTHVPHDLVDTFWSKVASWLAPGGQAMFIDNLESSAPRIQRRPNPGEEELMTRRLNDGREFTIVKTFWTPDALRDRLEPRWRVDAHATEHFFLHGTATPSR